MDKKSQKNKTVLVGVTGRLDSLVAAYLLKKQGHNVIALGIIFAPKVKDEEKEVIIDAESGEEKELDSHFQGVYLLDNPSDVRSVCERVEIPFYAADASKVYQDAITDKVVASRLGGLSFSPKVFATKVIFDVLEEKAEKLGADWIASGHYAKVIKNHKTDDYNIFISNDTKYDQSYQLSLLSQKTLSKTLLPLSEMRRVEVDKVAKMIGTELLPPNKDPLSLMKYEGLTPFIEKNAPPVMFKEGSVIDYKNDFLLGDHEGIHQYFVGQDNLKTKMGTPLAPELTVVKINYSGGSVYLNTLDDLSYKDVMLERISFQGKNDLTKPIEVFVKFSSAGQAIPATLYLKNNEQALLNLEESQKGLLCPGEYCVFYNREKGMARVIGGGIVFVGGFLENGSFRTLPKRDDFSDDKGGAHEKNDIYKLGF